MGKNQIELNSEDLIKIKAIGNINNIDVSTNEKTINLALKILNDIIKFSDESTFYQLTNLKKQF